jgi:hypothetical protein
MAILVHVWRKPTQMVHTTAHAPCSLAGVYEHAFYTEDKLTVDYTSEIIQRAFNQK